MTGQDPFLRIDLGACCACGKQDETVRNLVMLPEKAPVPGTGWGCQVCGLPSDGAMAILCDGCLEHNTEIRFAICGYATERQRCERSQLSGRHEHDQEIHAAVDRQRGKQLLTEYQAARINGNGHKQVRIKSKHRANHN